MKLKELLEYSKTVKEMKRCTKCILPETFPFIEFDGEGVCNYCKNHAKTNLKPIEELNALADKIRKNDGTHDCIVMFSGGRDSSYLLHYVKVVLKLNPIAFTYDWGMSTPVGDENAQTMCDLLDVERIIIKPSNEKKLKNVRLNVKAWAKNPVLGLIPLFTAGDKHFMVEVNKLSKELNISTVFIGTNPLEKTDFKTGFCGVEPLFNAKQIHSMTTNRKLKMISFYLKEFIKNPRYINSSLWESITAFFSFYEAKQEEIDIYKYIEWDENEVNSLLINTYKWKMANDTKTTWRIGDATAPFYNYAYYVGAGFTENDTFRSNQIRNNVLDRETALNLVKEENKPRPESMQWYFDRIEVSSTEVIKAVNNMKKEY